MNENVTNSSDGAPSFNAAEVHVPFRADLTEFKRDMQQVVQEFEKNLADAVARVGVPRTGLSTVTKQPSEGQAGEAVSDMTRSERDVMWFRRKLEDIDDRLKSIEAAAISRSTPGGG